MPSNPVAPHAHVMERLERSRRVSGDVEYWHARDLQEVLGYKKWENFDAAIRRATEALVAQGIDPTSQILERRRLARRGNTSVQPMADYVLTRGAAYLIAMNGDPKNPQIAAAQIYFAEQTRENEVDNSAREADAKRLLNRERLSHAVKSANSAAKAVGVKRYGLFTDAGSRSFYGMSQKDVAALKGVPDGEHLYEYAGNLELTGNAFRMELAAEQLAQDMISGEDHAIRVNRDVAQKVRATMEVQLGHGPEKLPLESEPIRDVKARMLGKPAPKKLAQRS